MSGVKPNYSSWDTVESVSGVEYIPVQANGEARKITTSELRKALGGDVGTGITVVDGVQSSATIDVTNVNADITFTAVAYGMVGDAITVTYVDPNGNDQVLSVSVIDTDIVVSLATDSEGTITSTAADIVTAIEASPEASALVTVVAEGTGLGIVEAVTETALANGVDVTPGLIGVLRVNADGDTCYIKVSEQVWKKFTIAGLA